MKDEFVAGLATDAPLSLFIHINLYTARELTFFISFTASTEFENKMAG